MGEVGRIYLLMFLHWHCFKIFTPY